MSEKCNAIGENGVNRKPSILLYWLWWKKVQKCKKKYDADPEDAFLALDVELFERKNWNSEKI